MNKIFFIVFTFGFLSSCLSTGSGSDKAFSVNPSYMTYGLIVQFYGKDYLLEEENKKAQIELRQPSYKQIPNVGYISIRVQGNSIDTGNPKAFTYILNDANGIEIFRNVGNDKIPNYNVSKYGTVWYAYDSIILNNKTVDFPLTLRIINPGVYGKSFVDFTISKKQN